MAPALSTMPTRSSGVMSGSTNGSMRLARELPACPRVGFKGLAIDPFGRGFAASFVADLPLADVDGAPCQPYQIVRNEQKGTKQRDNVMADETATLAAYVASLKFEDIPQEVRERAKAL